jgi:hypothetical protein
MSPPAKDTQKLSPSALKLRNYLQIDNWLHDEPKAKITGSSVFAKLSKSECVGVGYL